MHENENNVMRPSTSTRTRPTKRGRGRERELKIWPRDHVGLENLTSLVSISISISTSMLFLVYCITNRSASKNAKIKGAKIIS